MRYSNDAVGRHTSLANFKSRHAARRGAVYVCVLGVAMIVSVCALAGMHMARTELRSSRRANDLREAQLLAKSAVELAVSRMNGSLSNNLWRTTYTSGQETIPISVGRGAMSYRLVDDDGNLADDTTDSAWIDGYGRVGEAVWVERACVHNDRGQPLEALRTCLHSSRGLTLTNYSTLEVSGAPASTDGSLSFYGSTIRGDGEAQVWSGLGYCTGTIDTTLPRKGVPWPAVFNDYVAKATTLSYSSSNMQKLVLAPGFNGYGGSTNSRGIYYIKTGNGNLNITNMRLLGTLVIDAGTGTVDISGRVFMQPARPDYPVLIIKGKTILRIDSYPNLTLNESNSNKNFNPIGAPYNGSTDTDTSDSYPSEIQGLIHVNGDVELRQQGNYRGAVLVQGIVNVNGGSPTIIWDSNLIDNPPWGYSSTPKSTSMIVQRQSWIRQSSP